MTIHLIRHASAGRRTAAVDDENRMLDEHGRAQAVRIAQYLHSTPIQLVLSSPAMRCCETVGPLAEQLRIGIGLSVGLYEGRGATMALDLVRELAAESTTAALCSHGDVIPLLLDLLAADGANVVGAGCAKGSIWTLTPEAGQIARAQYTAVP